MCITTKLPTCDPHQVNVAEEGGLLWEAERSLAQRTLSVRPAGPAPATVLAFLALWSLQHSRLKADAETLPLLAATAPWEPFVSEFTGFF